MRSALHAAAADFVESLPDGMDTFCGEQGTGLSEGQAQRIAIARGLLRPGSILLMDEPTSSLDGETERLLLERLSGRWVTRHLFLSPTVKPLPASVPSRYGYGKATAPYNYFDRKE